ncbi:histidine kinase N-terminal 7TM domain-containing protein [Kineococcus sp. NUM-3379]
MLLWQPWALLFAVSALASLFAGRIMWRRRRDTGAAAALLVVLLGTAEWSAAKAVGLSLGSVAGQFHLSQVAFPGICAVVLGFLCLARAMCDRRWRWRWRREGLLLVPPALLTAGLLTNHRHELFARGLRLAGEPPVLTYEQGPLFWIHTCYSYVLLGAAVVLLLHGARRVSRGHRRRYLWPVVAGVVPTTGNVVGLWLLPGALPVDLTPVLFLVTAGACWWALEHSALPDVVPIALHQVVAAIGDAVVVVDRRERVLEANPAAVALLLRAPVPPIAAHPGGQGGRPLLGVPLQELTGALGIPLDETSPRQRTVTAPSGGTVLDVHTSPLTDDRGTCIGWAIVARDVTESLRQQQEVLAANEALREQLELVERLRAELAEQALRDPLTGLFNRRRMVEVLEREVPATLAAGRPVSLLMMDVDRFKQVNDTHGHATGDAVLVGMAAALAGGVRPREVLARFGGEEFVAVLPGVGEAEALARAEDWRARCAAVRVPGGGAAVGTTISIGLATASGSAPVGAEALLACADAALYEAKRGGRDRVVHVPAGTARVAARR